ncbi:putative peptidase [bacterium HR35]|nr:putative peptidase [bacterium HR35]
MIAAEIYIGGSIGAIILAPTIQIAVSIDPDHNDVGLTDFEGLVLIDFEILPHYNPSYGRELSYYQKTTSNKVISISNSQTIIINSKGRQL